MIASLIQWLRRVVSYFFGQSWVRFGIVGAAATGTYAVIALTTKYWGAPVFVANTLGYVLGFGVSYFGHMKWSFKSTARHRSALPKFLATQAVGLGLNSLIIGVLMHFGAPYVMAMPAAIVLVPIVVYFISKFWVFRSSAAYVPKYPARPSDPSGK